MDTLAVLLQTVIPAACDAVYHPALGHPGPT
jgi:hypothetical protein